MKKTSTFFTVVSFFWAALFLAASTQSVAREKVKLAYPSLTVNFAPLWMTYDKGFFKKNKVDVEMLYIRSSTSIQALIAGDIDLTGNNGATVAAANLRGADLVIIVGFINRSIFRVIASKEIRFPEQLKGEEDGDRSVWQRLRRSGPLCPNEMGVDAR